MRAEPLGAVFLRDRPSALPLKLNGLSGRKHDNSRHIALSELVSQIGSVRNLQQRRPVDLGFLGAQSLEFRGRRLLHGRAVYAHRA